MRIWIMWSRRLKMSLLLFLLFFTFPVTVSKGRLPKASFICLVKRVGVDIVGENSFEADFSIS